MSSLGYHSSWGTYPALAVFPTLTLANTPQGGSTVPCFGDVETEARKVYFLLYPRISLSWDKSWDRELKKKQVREIWSLDDITPRNLQLVSTQRVLSGLVLTLFGEGKPGPGKVEGKSLRNLFSLPRGTVAYH